MSVILSVVTRPLHSRTPDLTRPRTSDSVKSQVRLQLDIWCPPVPGLIRPGGVFANLPPVRIFYFLMNHEDTKSPRAATTAPSCLCSGTDLRQIYGGAKGVNPVSTLDRVCNDLQSREIRHGEFQLAPRAALRLLMVVLICCQTSSSCPSSSWC